MMSLHYYLNDGDRVMLVDDAKIQMDQPRSVVLDKCSHKDIRGLGGGIYDMIVFPWMPAPVIFTKAIEKVYWGGYVVVYGPEDEIGYQVIKGDPGTLVFRRPPPPPDWTREYYLEFQPRGKDWDAEKKTMHPSYFSKFEQMDVDWEGKTVIEYGCGRGEITRLIALAGVHNVWAVDLSEAAMDLACDFCDDLNNVTIVCANALEWRCPRFFIDVIVALDFVEHIQEDDLPRLFEQMYNNLKEGGSVHILTPLGRDAVRDHKWHPTPKTLRKYMEEAGFTYKRHIVPEGSRKFWAEFTK